MSRYAVPPPLQLMAQRAARGMEPGETVRLDLTHEVGASYVLDGVGEAAGELTLERVLLFEVLPDGGVRLVSQSTEVAAEEIHIGAQPKVPALGCGHPMGCGDPCGWCDEIKAACETLEKIGTAYQRLQARVAVLLSAAATGDAETCARLMAALGRRRA